MRVRRFRFSARHRTLWRLFWLAVLLVHAPATIKVFLGGAAGGEDAAWSSLLLISATNLFFLFEVASAWSLRLLADRRATIAFILVIALLHVGVVDHGLPTAAFAEPITRWWIVLASISILILLKIAALTFLTRTIDLDGLATARHRSRRTCALSVSPVLRRSFLCRWNVAPDAPSGPSSR